MDALRTILAGFQWSVLVYFVAVNAFLVVLLVAAARELVDQRRLARLEARWRLLSSAVAPRISILAPAYNEELTVGESVRSLLLLRYPNLEVVLVNDGSSDATLDRLTRDFQLRALPPVYQRLVDHRPILGLYRSDPSPGLVVVDKVNGGKADALNAGLNVATGDLVCAIDADTIIDADALLRMIRPFLFRENIVAAGGTIRAINGSEVRHGRVHAAHAPRRIVPGLQTIEYLRAFLTGRLGWNRLGGNLIISGAFGLFRRDTVLAVGGYERATVGEDMELVARLRRHSYDTDGPGRVEFVPDPVAWTEVPDSLRVLGRQRDRWHRGLADVMRRHRGVALRPRYGTLGWVAYPYFLVVELLAPLIEALGLAGLALALATGAVDGEFAALFFLLAYGLGLVLTASTIALDQFTYRSYGGGRDTLVLLAWAIIEPLGYRQLTVAWRLRGLWNYLRGRTHWGVMTRAGFGGSPTLE